ncbi:MAG: MFS transporter, partial [Acidimicrobiia bacterium]|nr:MFS transporter [Acidimicrobiia bacterium]
MTANPSEGPDTSDDKLRRPSPAQVPWAIVLAGAVIGLLSMGIRQSLGVFLLAVSEDLGPGREPFSLAVAVLSFLMGLPVAGYLADRYDHRRVLLVCSLLYGGSLVTVSTLQTSGGLVLYLGVMAGLGTSGLSFGVLMGAVGRLVPAGRRSAMMGVVGAGASKRIKKVSPPPPLRPEGETGTGDFITHG